MDYYLSEQNCYQRLEDEFKKYGVTYHSSEWCLLPVSKQYGGITADWATETAALQVLVLDDQAILPSGEVELPAAYGV